MKPIPVEKRKVVVITESATKSQRLQTLVAEFSKRSWKFFEVSKTVFDFPKTGDWYDASFHPIWNINKSVHNLKTSLLYADEAYICTDLDTEGEALAYHIQDLILKHSDSKARRVIIDEINQNNLIIALAASDSVSTSTALSHFARLVITKLITDELRPAIKKAGRILDLKGHIIEYNLQTFPLLSLLVQRERERRGFVPTKRIYVDAVICKGKAKATSLAYTTKESTTKMMECLRHAQEEEELEIDFAEKSEEKKPLPPFTTSSLLRAMSNLHSWKPRETLQAARVLYDSGVITYFKTNRLALNRRFAKQLWNYCRAEGLPVLDLVRNFSSPGEGEVIRPTEFLKPEDLVVRDKIARDLYQIIWDRTIATQLKPSVVRKQTVDYTVEDGYTVLLTAEGSVVDIVGYNPPTPAQELDPKTLHRIGDLTTREEISQPPPRYTVAHLIKWMDDKAIGNADIYTDTIENLIDNMFVQEDDQGELVVTERGELIYTIISNIVPDLLDPLFCAQLEDDIADIAAERADYTETVKGYHTWLKGQRLHRSSYEFPYPESCPQCQAPTKGAMDHRHRNPYVTCKTCKWWGFITFDTEGKIILKTVSPSPNTDKDNNSNGIP